MLLKTTYKNKQHAKNKRNESTKLCAKSKTHDFKSNQNRTFTVKHEAS